jgi:hypothetical protein
MQVKKSVSRRHRQKNLGQKNKTFHSPICSYFFAPDFFARVLDFRFFSRLSERGAAILIHTSPSPSHDPHPE